MMNVKANHRKVIVTERAGLVSSSNPHDASGYHGNLALKVSGTVLNDLLEAEEAIFNYTTGQTGQTLPRVDVEGIKEGQYSVQYVTEQKIKDILIENITSAGKGDRVRIGMFFIAEPKVVKALTQAADRGVDIKLILDPNENSFGNDKSGIPNRPVVQKLIEDSDEAIEVRWYNTVIGQYHTKLVMIDSGDSVNILNGSANLTERTLDNYNLESDLHVIAPKNSELAEELNEYFERLWNNEDALYTLDVEEFQSAMTRPQRVIYALQEWLKLTSY
ncbi:phospholipase D-like domain-containing protein [Sporosarcina sp. CAU 1771]